MRIIRLLGSVVLWLGALLGLLAGGVWVANQAGYLQSMVVISGSMEPEIMTGDLLIDRWMPVEDVEIGDVLSLPSEFTGKLVTHRVISVNPLSPTNASDAGVDLSAGPVWEIRMKGDANADPDSEPYYVEDEALSPWIRIPHGGKVVSKIMEPAVAVPILLALVALLGLSLLDEEPRKIVRRVVRRVAGDPKVEALDEELAAVGVDVTHLQTMNDLDLQLYALGIDIDDRHHDEAPFDDDRGDAGVAHPADDDLLWFAVNGRGVDDGLWDFSLPPSDGIALVPTPAFTRDAADAVFVVDTDLVADHRTPTPSPARSG